jgi:hypothetical protein
MAERSELPPRGPVEVTVADAAGATEFVAGDEPLLERPGRAVRVAVLSERCLSYGVGVPSAAGYLRSAAARGIPTVRRRTGGTGLLHEPGDLAWTVVLPRREPRAGADFTRAYERLGRGVVRWLAQLGLAGAWTAPPGLSPEYCTLGERGTVLTVGSGILGGAAQHVTRDRLLHHGTISWTVDRPAIERLFHLGRPDVTRRLVGLHDLEVPRPGALRARDLASAIAADLASE